MASWQGDTSKYDPPGSSKINKSNKDKPSPKKEDASSTKSWSPKSGRTSPRVSNSPGFTDLLRTGHGAKRSSSLTEPPHNSQCLTSSSNKSALERSSSADSKCKGSPQHASSTRRLLRLKKVDSYSKELEPREPCASPILQHRSFSEAIPTRSHGDMNSKRSYSEDYVGSPRLSRPESPQTKSTSSSPRIGSATRSSSGLHNTPSCSGSPESGKQQAYLSNSYSSIETAGKHAEGEIDGSYGISDPDEVQDHVKWIEEEKPVVKGINIRGATMELLVLHLINCLDDNGDLGHDGVEFTKVFLQMHEWFTTSSHLARNVMELYEHIAPASYCHTPDCTHALENDKCGVQKYKAKICHFFRYWIQHFPMCFNLNTELSMLMVTFHHSLLNDGDNKNGKLLDLSDVPSYDWVRNMSVRNPSGRHVNTTKTPLVFSHLTPTQLAEQLTYLEYKAMRRITFSDFKNYAQKATLKDNPRLERSVALFNGLSQWVQCMVLSKTTPQQRANVIVKFVGVAKRLKFLQNFNTLMAVVGGLTHSSLARLNKTNACIPPDIQKTLAELADVLSSSNNFCTYRKVLQQCHGFIIPILGVHLKDLILLHTALPDYLEGRLINFRKVAQMSQIFDQLMYTSQSPDCTLPMEPNLDLVNTIKLSLDLHYSEDEIYELSLAREPRNSLSSPSTPTKSVVFADWVSGVSPPDSETINNHVHDMVESVFKFYDHDRDGFISHAEFEEIAGNFPFIDSFCVLDADQDGMISRAEMKTYFIRANCHALRNSFKHAFHETTYFKPTFCIHCTGLLWGIIKQGWKCKDCNINAHKHCKDLVVMECRSKSHTSAHGRSTSQPNGGVQGTNNNYNNTDMTLAAKRKMSQRFRRSHANRSTQTESTSTQTEDIEQESENPESSATCARKISTIREKSQEFYEEQSAIHERLIKAEEERDKLLLENKTMRSKLDAQNEQISTLKMHIGLIRQHTVTFILNQMDTLHMQRDTEV